MYLLLALFVIFLVLACTGWDVALTLVICCCAAAAVCVFMLIRAVVCGLKSSGEGGQDSEPEPPEEELSREDRGMSQEDQEMINYWLIKTENDRWEEKHRR